MSEPKYRVPTLVPSLIGILLAVSLFAATYLECPATITSIGKGGVTVEYVDERYGDTKTARVGLAHPEYLELGQSVTFVRTFLWTALKTQTK